MALDSRLHKANSTWEIWSNQNPSVLDGDECARAILNDTLYASTSAIGFGEFYIASKIRRMMELPARNIRMVDSSNALSESQKIAASKVLSSNISILTGGPGTGKTYTLAAIAESLHRSRIETAYCAPTGTAAKRISTSIGRESSTIHRLLRWRPNTGYGYNENNPLPYECVVVDEATMKDSALSHALFRALGDARLIMVGDHNQLPPVNIGRPFHSLVGVVPTAYLTEVRRTDPDGPIGRACLSILAGEMPEQSKKGESGFFIIPRPANTLTDYLLHCALRMSPDVHRVGILSPFNYSCEKINSYFLEYSRMHPIGMYPIMCLKNDYETEIFNGEIGLANRFPCNSFLFEGNHIAFNRWRDTLAFARTIHKSQGGEWDDVLLHLPKNNFVSRNLSYTAVSRGKNRVAVVGCIDSFASSLKDNRCDKRVSLLGELVTGEAVIIQ